MQPSFPFVVTLKGSFGLYRFMLSFPAELSSFLMATVP